MQDDATKTKSLYPTEEVDLATKGLCYKKDNPLSSGKIEMQYLSAKEEDILTNQNFIKKGIVLDKLFQSMIVSPINYDDLLIADKDKIMVAARILSYGSDYDVKVKCPNCDNPPQPTTIKLSEVNDKEINFDLLNENNEYEVKLPICKKTITFKLLTIGDEKKIADELNMHKAIAEKTNIKNIQVPELSTRLKHVIVAINGNRDTDAIRKFVDGELLAADSRILRQKIKEISPGVDLTYTFKCDNEECGHITNMAIPMEVNFFWPDAGI